MIVAIKMMSMIILIKRTYTIANKITIITMIIIIAVTKQKKL